VRNDPNFTVPRRAGGSAIDLATAMAETERAEQLILSVAMSSLPKTRAKTLKRRAMRHSKST